jgi:hypothetical protein
MHQVEQVLANQLPTILGAMLMGSHLLTFWVWLFLRIVETIEAHSGYVLARGVCASWWLASSSHAAGTHSH